MNSFTQSWAIYIARNLQKTTSQTDSTIDVISVSQSSVEQKHGKILLPSFMGTILRSSHQDCTTFFIENHVVLAPGYYEQKMSKQEKHGQLPLLAAYKVPDPIAVTPATDDMNTILPLPDAFKCGWASWHVWYTDSKLVAMIKANSSDVYSTVGFRIFVPTLLTWTPIPIW